MLKDSHSGFLPITKTYKKYLVKIAGDHQETWDWDLDLFKQTYTTVLKHSEYYNRFEENKANNFAF